MNLHKLAYLTAIVISLVGCQRAADNADPVLVRAGEHALRVTDFDAFLQRPPVRPRLVSRENLRRWLDAMIEELLIRDAAKALGVAERPASDSPLLLRAALVKLEQDWTPAESEVQRYYEKQKERFLSRRVLLDVLEFADPASAERARERIAALGVEPATGFAPALDDSYPITRLGWLTRTSAPPSARTSVMTLRAGDPVGAVVADDGLARIYLLRDEEQNVPRALDEVRAQLVLELRQLNASATWRRLLDERRASVRIDASVLETLLVERTSQASPDSVHVTVPKADDDEQKRATHSGH